MVGAVVAAVTLHKHCTSCVSIDGNGNEWKGPTSNARHARARCGNEPSGGSSAEEVQTVHISHCGDGMDR
jgi:hypothetical protein